MKFKHPTEGNNRHFETATGVKTIVLSKSCFQDIFEICLEVYLDVVDPKPPCSLSDPADWGQMGHWSVQVQRCVVTRYDKIKAGHCIFRDHII